MRDGTVAWMTATGRGAQLQVAARAGSTGATGGSVVLARGGIGALAVEDRGTLRWRVGAGHQFRDLLSRPKVDGCPVRSRFPHDRAMLSTPDVLVTAAEYEIGLSPVRACLRATGTDPVIGDTGEGNVVKVIAGSGDWLFVVHGIGNRYSCAGFEVYALNLRSSAVGRRAGSKQCDGTYNPQAGSAAITTAGVLAWITPPVSGKTTSSLLTITADGTTVELDRGSTATSLANLKVEGTRFTWTDDGVPQEAAPV